MLTVPCYCPSSLSNSYYIGMVMVMVISLPYYCAMGPYINVFSLNTYSRRYWKNRILSGSIIFLIIFVCLFTNTLWCSSSLSMLIGILFIIGMIPLVGPLNTSFAGLGSPGPSGIIVICNKARCISELVSWHF